MTIDVSPGHAAAAGHRHRLLDLLPVGQEECAQFIVDRGIKVDDLFTETWKLDQAEEAYKLFDQQNTGKGVFLI